jgi:hypothetical protein
VRQNSAQLGEAIYREFLRTSNANSPRKLIVWNAAGMLKGWSELAMHTCLAYDTVEVFAAYHTSLAEVQMPLARCHMRSIRLCRALWRLPQNPRWRVSEQRVLNFHALFPR